MATPGTENLTTGSIGIARTAYDAYVTKDRAALEALLAGTFTSRAVSTIGSIRRPASAIAGQTAR